MKIFRDIGLEELKKQYSVKDLLKRQNIDFDIIKKIDDKILIPED